MRRGARRLDALAALRPGGPESAHVCALAADDCGVDLHELVLVPETRDPSSVAGGTLSAKHSLTTSHASRRCWRSPTTYTVR